MRKYIFWIIIMAIGIIAVLAAYFLGQTGEIPLAQAAYAQMNPTVYDDGGVDINSAFTISFESPVSAAQIRKFLSVEPFLELGMHQGKNNQEVLVVPSEPLAPNTLYRFKLNSEGGNLGFAFQTKAPLEIKGVFPADKSLDIPLDTSIRVIFNTANNANCQPYFKIEPKTEGRFEFNGRTVSFIPEGPLAPETIYTVTALAGWPLSGSSILLEESYQFQFETAPKNGEGGAQIKLSMAGQSFLPGELPFFRLDNLDNPDSGNFANVKIYAYEDPKSYGEALLKDIQNLPAWSRKAENSSLSDFNLLRPVMERDLPLIEGEGCHYLVLPEDLPLGHYALDMSLGDINRRLHFQVSALKAFVQPGIEETLIWLKDSKTGNSLGGRKIRELIGGDSSLTGEDGIALIKGVSPQGFAIYYIEDIKDKGNALVLSQRSASPLNKGLPNGLTVYLYTDRYYYQNNDTLKFWGIIKAPPGEETVLPELKMALYGHLEQEGIINESPLELIGNTFSGEFDLRNFNNGGYSLGLIGGGEIFARRDFLVEEPFAPQYKLEITGPEKAIFCGEDLVFKIILRDFENRGVPGIRLDYRLLDGEKGSINTDKNGRANLVLSPQSYNQGDGHEDISGLNPKELKTLKVSATTPNGLKLEALASALILKSPVEIESRAGIIRGRGIFKWEIYLADTEKVEFNPAAILKDGDFKKDPLAGQKIKAEIFRLEIKEEIPGLKEGVGPDTGYKEEKLKIAEKELITNAQGRAYLELNLPEKLRPDFKYLICLKSLGGEDFKLEYYFYPWLKNSSGPYYIALDKPEGYIEGESFTAVFSEGDAGDLRTGELRSEELKGDFLFYNQNAPGDNYQAGKAPEYTGVFEAGEYSCLCGVYFDGRNFNPAKAALIKNKNALPGLNISILADKATYSPGERGKITIEVRDENNKPIEADLHLRIAPAAALAGDDGGGFTEIFSLPGERADLPKPLLSHEDWQTKPHEYRLQGPAPEYFGESVNNNVPLFSGAKTDKEGVFELEFTAPAQAGKYIISGLSYNKDNQDFKTGAGESFFEVKSAFSLGIIANSHYINGDSPTIFLKAVGGPDQGVINYELLIEGPEGSSKLLASGEAEQTVKVDLGILAAGDYRIEASAFSPGGEKAKAGCSFAVKEDFIEIHHWESAPLEQGEVSFKGEGDSSLLIVSSPQRSIVLEDLWQAAGDISPRLENRIAKAAAQRLLKDYLGDELDILIETQDDDLRSYQNHDGGAAPLPGAASDLELSVKAAALGSYQFANEELSAYFTINSQNAQNNKDFALSLAGLAALDKPVLNEIKGLLNKENLSAEERLYLLWALAVAGDSQNAERQLKSLLAEKGEGLALCRQNGDLTPEQAYNCRLWIMMISSLYGDTEQWEAARNEVLEGSGMNNPASIEIVLASRAVLPRLKNEESAFSYNLENSGYKINLSPGEDFCLILSPDKLKTLSFKNVKGSPNITCLYKTPLANETFIAEGGEIGRYYSITSGGGQELKAGVMKIKIDYTLEEGLEPGWYYISDCLPGGLAPFEGEGLNPGQGVTPRLFSPGGQITSFMIYKEEGRELKGSHVYYAKVVSAGRFIARPAIITQGLNHKIIAKAEEKIIRIK